MAKLTSNEWYTPGKYVEAARSVLGGIDLDPASCEMANRTVKARHYYTREDNGLERSWTTVDGKPSRTWINPPFGRLANGKSRIRLFLEKLIEEYKCGNVAAAVALVKADPKQNWFVPLWAYPICFARDRVYFFRPDGPPEKNQFGVAFVYLGPDEARFIEVFSRVGTIAKSVKYPEAVFNESLWK